MKTYIDVYGKPTPYLHITISDNGFMTYPWALEAAIKELFERVKYPKKEELESLREPIANLWTGLHLLWEALNHYRIDYFINLRFFIKERMKLNIVDFSEIPDDDNHESIFIPLFDGAPSFFR